MDFAVLVASDCVRPLLVRQKYDQVWLTRQVHTANSPQPVRLCDFHLRLNKRAAHRASPL